jgi:hypothetical protein
MYSGLDRNRWTRRATRRRAGRLDTLDINLVWAIATFFLGAILTRLNESSRHAREVQAAREQAFEAMQRDTWVGTHDALAELWEAASSLVIAVQAHNEAVAQWNKSSTRHLIEGNPAPELGPAFYAARSKYVGATQRATAVASRLADEGVDELAHDAIRSIADYRANWSKTDEPHGVSRWTRANEATEEALLELVR